MIKLDEKIISICITIFILITVVSPIFTITAEAADTNYYISNSGNDANSGTSPDQAWKTKTKLNTELNPAGGCINDGDDIYFNRGDNFSEDVYIALKTTDGTASDPMVFGAYGTGADPIIYGSTVASSPQFYFTSGGIGYLTFENLYFKAYPGCPSNYNFIAGNSGDKNNITIRNCTFDGNNYGANANKGRVPMRNVHNYTIEYCTFIDASHYLYGAGAGGEPCSNTKMMHCTIDAKGGSQDNMQIHCDYDDPTGVSSNHYIYNVTSTNCTSNAFDIVGGWYNQYRCNNVYIKNCTGKVTGSNSPIVIAHGSANVTVDNCYFEGALYFTNSNDSIVRNCVFKSSGAGGYIISQDDPQWPFSILQNCTIYNNDFIIGSTKRFIHGNVGATSPENLSGFTVKNNIFYSMDDPNMFLIYSDSDTADHYNLSNTDSNYSYNMWWRANGDVETDLWQDEDGTYNLTEWNALNEVTGELGQNASIYNPNGTDFATDFNLNSNSPAIDAGDWLTECNGGGTGTVITVTDSHYFFAGIPSLDITGDNIFVGDDTNLVITSIDHKLSQITVNRSITWSDNDDVSLSSYSGSKPDIGAKEYPSSGPNDNPPEISNIIRSESNPLDTEPSFGWINITTTVIGYSAIDTVMIDISCSNSSNVNTSMNAIGTNGYYYNTSSLFSNNGSYSYYIWANDINGNASISSSYDFSMPPNWDIDMNGVCNVLDFVLIANHLDETGSLGWVREDVDNNGIINMLDLVLVSEHYFETW